MITILGGGVAGAALAVEPVERGAFQVNPGVVLPNNVPLLIDTTQV